MAKRNIGIELMRIILMMMILCLHILGHGGVINNIPYLSYKYIIVWLLETMSFCAVNGYAIIIGYVMVDKKVKLENVIILWIKVVFYLVLFSLIFALIKNNDISFDSIISNFFPIINSKYWYFTAYIGMLLFAPIVNGYFNSHDIDWKKTKFLLIIMIILFSVIPSFTKIDIFCMANGYNAFWLLFMYIIGAYFKKSNSLSKLNLLISLGCYLLCILISWGLKMYFDFGHIKNIFFINDGGILINYTSPTMIMASIFLLSFFTKIKFNILFQKFILFFSKFSFSVYLIHETPSIREYIIENKFVFLCSYNAIALFIIVIITSFLSYFLLSLIDYFRDLLFEKIKIRYFIAKIVKILNIKILKENN